MSDYSSDYDDNDFNDEDDDDNFDFIAPRPRINPKARRKEITENTTLQFQFDRNNEENFESDVRRKIQAKLSAKKDDNSGALISEIHEQILTRYNSVNVIVGKQSLGKTVVALEEIIKISYLDTHHMLVYVTKDGEENDRSWNTLKGLIEMPILLVSEENAEACIDELIAAKSLYYKVRRDRTKNILDKRQKQDLFDTLQVDNFEKSFLHTLILFDDISNSKLFSSEESFFSQLLRRCRHNNLSFYLLIQGWKGIKPHIKNEITTIYIFPGFNKQQVRYIYSQSSSYLDFEDFYKVYQDVNKKKREHPDEHPLLIVQCTEGGETYIRS